MEQNLRSIGRKIYTARKQNNFTQKEICAKLGMNQSTYSRLENGEYDIPITQLIKVCETLDVSLSWLLNDDIIHQLTDSERLLLTEFIKFLQSRQK